MPDFNTIHMLVYTIVTPYSVTQGVASSHQARRYQGGAHVVALRGCLQWQCLTCRALPSGSTIHEAEHLSSTHVEMEISFESSTIGSFRTRKFVMEVDSPDERRMIYKSASNAAKMSFWQHQTSEHSQQSIDDIFKLVQETPHLRSCI